MRKEPIVATTDNLDEFFDKLYKRISDHEDEYEKMYGFTDPRLAFYEARTIRQAAEILKNPDKHHLSKKMREKLVDNLLVATQKHEERLKGMSIVTFARKEKKKE
ncbi:MAG: hypothetical protein LKJ22_07540 [Liquorilactobacillus nagelii]|jgi:hypothetical protein|uniref:hypothetical protein n=1 Tax=Liquorilactobacillus nagelii TaxID=82688 RepID=UPI002432615D|nr:hypothetical protein [Liquorilactobacillus nagelii]MCI1921766.1 hypothetical protein [Liquorilactobacillus nagelii]MCI1976716.1 hypothetical protein [Liquorilactobacillus nagelii]